MEKAPKDTTSQLSKAAHVLHVPRAAAQKSSLASTADTSVTSVSGEYNVAVTSKVVQEGTVSSSEEYQQRCGHKNVGSHWVPNIDSFPCGYDGTATKRKSDELEGGNSQNCDLNVDSCKHRALESSLFRSQETRSAHCITGESVEIGPADDCATISPEPKRTAVTPSLAEPALLTKTAEGTREKTVPRPRSWNGPSDSWPPPTTTAPAPNPEQASAGMFQPSSGDSSAGILQTPHTEAWDNGGRPDNGYRESISSVTSEPVGSRSATGAAYSLHTAVMREHAYARLDTSAGEMVPQDRNSARTCGTTNIALVSTLALESPLDPVAQVAATPVSAMQWSDRLLPASTRRFQHAPAESHSVSRPGNAITSATGGNSGPDGCVSSVYRATALPPANNVSDSSNDTSEQRRRKVCASYPIVTSLLEDKQRMGNDQSTRTARHQDIPQTPPTHSTTGGYVQPSGDFILNRALQQAHDDLPTGHRYEQNGVAERLLTRVGGHRDMMDARQASQQPSGVAAPSYNKASSISAPPGTGTAQPKPASRPRSALAGTVTQPACSSGSDSLVATQESVSQEPNAFMKTKQGAPLEGSSQPRISLPAADDDGPSLESFFKEHKTIPLHLWKAGSNEQISENSVPIPESSSTGKKAFMESCQLAARHKRSWQQISSPPSDDSVPSLESLSPDQKLSMESTAEATLPKCSKKQMSSSDRDDPVPSLQSLSPEQNVSMESSEQPAQQMPSQQMPMPVSNNILGPPVQEVVPRIKASQQHAKPEFKPQDMPLQGMRCDDTRPFAESIAPGSFSKPATNNSSGPQEWPRPRTTQQASFTPFAFPLTTHHPFTQPQGLPSLRNNQLALAPDFRHQGAGRQPAVPPSANYSSKPAGLPPENTFQKLEDIQAPSPKILQPLKAALPQAASHYSGMAVRNVYTPMTWGAEMYGKASAVRHLLEAQELQNQILANQEVLRRQDAPVSYMPHHSDAARIQETSDTGHGRATNHSPVIRPVTASLSSDTQRVPLPTPSNLFPFDWTISDLPPAREPFPQVTDEDLELLNSGYTHEKPEQPELSHKVMPMGHDSPTGKMRGPSVQAWQTSLPASSNRLPNHNFLSQNANFSYHQTSQGAQTSSTWVHPASVAQQQGNEHMPWHRNYQQPCFVQNQGAITRHSQPVLVRPAARIQPFMHSQALQASTPSNLVSNPTYPTPSSTSDQWPFLHSQAVQASSSPNLISNPTHPTSFSTSGQWQVVPHSMSHIESVQKANSYIRPGTPLEQTIPLRRQQATSSSADQAM